MLADDSMRNEWYGSGEEEVERQRAETIAASPQRPARRTVAASGGSSSASAIVPTFMVVAEAAAGTSTQTITSSSERTRARRAPALRRSVSGAPSARRARPSRQGADPVEREVELEHVDAVAAEESERRRLTWLRRAPDRGRVEAARARHAVHLDQRARQRDVGVEARGRRGHEVDRHLGAATPFAFAAAARRSCTAAARSALFGPRFEPPGAAGVVVAGGRRGWKHCAPFHSWPSRRGADDAAVDVHERAVGLVGEAGLRRCPRPRAGRRRRRRR